MPPSAPRIVICGAGVIGAAVAYFLALRGARPLVVDRARPGAAASGKASGFLALDWSAGTPLDALSRASFAMHRELAAALGPERIGHRPMDALMVAAADEEDLERYRRLPSPDWLDGNVAAPRGHRDAGDDRTGDPPRLHHGADRGGRRARGDPGHRGRRARETPGEYRLYPRPDGTVYATGHREHGSLPDDPDEIAPADAACDLLRRVAGVHASRLRDAEPAGRSACVRPLTVDGLPLIRPGPGRAGRVPRHGARLVGDPHRAGHGADDRGDDPRRRLALPRRGPVRRLPAPGRSRRQPGRLIEPEPAPRAARSRPTAR